MRKISVIFGALLVLMAVLTPMAVADLETKDTLATVSSTGAPSIVEYKFELHDEDPIEPGVQVVPVPLGQKVVELYAIVSDPNGAANIDHVEFKVWYPLTIPNVDGDGLQNYLPLAHELVWTTDSATIIAILNEAIAEGRLTDADVNDPNTGIIKHLENYEWRFFMDTTTLEYFDVSGDYTVMAVAKDAGGSPPVPLENTFTYISIKSIGVDFQAVDYGEIIPSTPQIVSGDIDMTTSQFPTVRNEGNDPFRLEISATDMEGSNFQNIISASDLDSKVYGVETYAVVPDGYVALGPNINQNLYLDTVGVLFSLPLVSPDTWDTTVQIFNPTTKVQTGVHLLTGIRQIDFSIHAPYGTTSDIYSGTVTLEAVV